MAYFLILTQFLSLLYFRENLQLPFHLFTKVFRSGGGNNFYFLRVTCIN
jgi:hypothetical protein